MSDEKFVSIAPGTILARLNPLKQNTHRGQAGKINRFPDGIREQLNLRLFSGEPGYQILAWLNRLPTAKAVFTAEFNGMPVSHANLRHWRLGGYQHWLCEKSRADIANTLCESDGPTAAAANRACGKILEFLKTAKPAQINHRQLLKCAGMAFALMNMKQKAVRIYIAGRDVCRHDLQATLQRHLQRLCFATPPFSRSTQLNQIEPDST
jgi:hypothetical protein